MFIWSLLMYTSHRDGELESANAKSTKMPCGSSITKRSSISKTRLATAMATMMKMNVNRLVRRLCYTYSLHPRTTGPFTITISKFHTVNF